MNTLIYEMNYITIFIQFIYSLNPNTFFSTLFKAKVIVYFISLWGLNIIHACCWQLMKSTQDHGRPLLPHKWFLIAKHQLWKTVNNAPDTSAHLKNSSQAGKSIQNKAEDQPNLCAGIFLPPSPEKNVQFGQARKREAEREREKKNWADPSKQ